MTTVETATVDKEDNTNTPYSVVVNVTIKNVHNELVDLSELNFELKNETGEMSNEGKLLVNDPSKMQVKPNDSTTLNVSFEVPSIEEEYMFYIHSSLEPIPAHWKIDNLNQSVS
ncbi:DUF4352 domain-containing protein [Mesobacillus foraminis]|uniref:DUF4352 domain-containing protein n=1 Tax=Mesobacillus foraminis TaxID=279826 RepID=UPI001BEC169F|nr:DUF4352 domain-containing protein [Mesobacillus foraminis]MBT2757937.1 DUF4352 domain-containing protein [Mesobacillus foraminis]